MRYSLEYLEHLIYEIFWSYLWQMIPCSSFKPCCQRNSDFHFQPFTRKLTFHQPRCLQERGAVALGDRCPAKAQRLKSPNFLDTNTILFVTNRVSGPCAHMRVANITFVKGRTAPFFWISPSRTWQMDISHTKADKIIKTLNETDWKGYLTILVAMAQGYPTVFAIAV